MTDIKRTTKLRAAAFSALIGFGTFGVLAGLVYLWLWGTLAAWHRYGLLPAVFVGLVPVLLAFGSRLTVILYKGAIARLVEKGKMSESER